jgi:hypothetical protein
MSRAMHRVSAALRRHAPEGVRAVDRSEKADLQILHVIGSDAIEYRSRAPRTATIQYCYRTAGDTHPGWPNFWSRNVAVWSYYNLQSLIPAGTVFYLAPLGIDASFCEEPRDEKRIIGVVTTGYVTGAGAEAIEEMMWAAHEAGLQTIHIGPQPVGLTRRVPPSWRSMHGITDTQLADIYRHAKWVSGLRHVEGFEMPVIEGLACGARPIVFDRADMRQWYDGHAVFIDELDDRVALTEQLKNVLRDCPSPVTMPERREVLAKFDWKTIARGFWSAILEGLETR